MSCCTATVTLASFSAASLFLVLAVDVFVCVFDSIVLNTVHVLDVCVNTSLAAAAVKVIGDHRVDCRLLGPVRNVEIVEVIIIIECHLL